jgi:hypothetical protein
MGVGEFHERCDAAGLGNGVRVGDDDVLPTRGLNAFVDVGGETEGALVLGDADVRRQRLGPAVGPVRNDHELVHLRVQRRQRVAQERGLSPTGGDEDAGDLHAARILR